MREPLRDPSRIFHIQKAINKIENFMDGKTLQDLDDESVLFFAVVKNLEIIGEAAYKLTDEFKSAHSDVLWQDYVKLRHVLVHGYYTINPQIVFDICKDDIPKLKQQLSKELS